MIAEDKKLKIYLTNDRCPEELEALRMGFGGFKESEIPKAVQAFAEVWFECTNQTSTLSFKEIKQTINLM